ncbi:ShET2/EspL2 family type III secretion system effector toxin [Pseudomonas sp. SDO528_S397]
MPKISSSLPPVAPFNPPAPSVAAQAAPAPPRQAPVSAEAASPQSLQERAISASRTQLNTLALSAGTAGSVVSVVPRAPSSSGQAAHPARAAVAKDQLYEPTKRPQKNFNTQVVLPDHEGDTDTFMARTEVACRHLAFEYFSTPKKADFLQRVGSKAGIEQYFSNGRLRSANLAFNRLTGAANLHNSCVVSADAFPERIMDIAEIMTHNRTRNTDLLITSSDHVWALNIKIKEQGRVCVTLYEPNLTTNHYRVVARDFDDGKALESLDLPLHHHRMQGSHAFILHAQAPFFTSDRALESLRASQDSPPLQVLTSAIHNALDRDDPALLDQLLGKANRDHRMDRRDLKAAFESAANGVSGMAVALQNNRVQTVTTWMARVRNLALSGSLKPEDVFELCKPTVKSGGKKTNGLFLAMAGKHTPVITAFMSQVTETAARGLLTRAQVKDIFSPADSVKNLGIHTIWYQADARSMTAVVQQLQDCHQRKVLASDDIKELLLGKGPKMKKGTLSVRDMDAFKRALQPLIDGKVLKQEDVDGLFVARGLAGKPAKTSLLARVFH